MIVHVLGGVNIHQEILVVVASSPGTFRNVLTLRRDHEHGFEQYAELSKIGVGPYQ